MKWVENGVNYWLNPNCPREYLEEALVQLVAEVEGFSMEFDQIKCLSGEELRKEVSRYEVSRYEELTEK